MSINTRAKKNSNSSGSLQKVFAVGVIVIMLVLLTVVGLANQNNNKYGYKSKAMEINIPTISLPTIAINAVVPTIDSVAVPPESGNILGTLLSFLQGQGSSFFQNILKSLLGGAMPGVAPSPSRSSTPGTATAVTPEPGTTSPPPSPTGQTQSTVAPTTPPSQPPSGVCQVIDPWGKSSNLKVGVSQCSCVMGVCAQATCSTCNSTSPCVCKPNSMPSDAGSTLPCTNGGGLFIKKVSGC
ncbi:MAG: hypothetical protein V1922_01035 [bacterium]